MYIFLDESGNFVFSQKGTQYLVFTALTIQKPFILMDNINKLKHSLIKEGQYVEFFHATEDKQLVRNQVFVILNKNQDFEIDSIIVEKTKTNPFLQDPTKLYIKVYEILLKYIFNRHTPTEVTIFTDTIPFKEKRRDIEKGLKEGIRKVLGKRNKFHILHHSSKSHFCLQATDYCCWAIYKKMGDWGKHKDIRPYNEINTKVKSEFEIFKKGTTIYY